MENSTNIKNDTVLNQSATLTVVVLDSKSNPTEGAHVSIKPSDASGVTNSAGEIQFKLGSATRYDITASNDGNTVTVPYYVTKDGATRLVINPTYVRSIEKKLHPSFFSTNFIYGTGIFLGVVVIFFVAQKLFKRKNKK